MRPALLLAMACACAWPGRAAAEPWPDGDRLVDDDPTATCRAEHAVPTTTAARPAAAWTPPSCRRHARLRPDRIELLGRIAFDLDKATLRPASFVILDDVAAILLAVPDLRVEIQGHGRDEEHRARRLSDDRAEAVEAYLIMRGVDAGRLMANGYGDNVPLVPWKAKDAHARNVRIELRLLPPPAA